MVRSIAASVRLEAATSKRTASSKMPEALKRASINVNQPSGLWSQYVGSLTSNLAGAGAGAAGG